MLIIIAIASATVIASAWPESEAKRERNRLAREASDRESAIRARELIDRMLPIREAILRERGEI